MGKRGAITRMEAVKLRRFLSRFFDLFRYQPRDMQFSRFVAHLGLFVGAISLAAGQAINYIADARSVTGTVSQTGAPGPTYASLTDVPDSPFQPTSLFVSAQIPGAGAIASQTSSFGPQLLTFTSNVAPGASAGPNGWGNSVANSSANSTFNVTFSVTELSLFQLSMYRSVNYLGELWLSTAGGDIAHFWGFGNSNDFSASGVLNPGVVYTLRGELTSTAGADAFNYPNYSFPANMSAQFRVAGVPEGGITWIFFITTLLTLYSICGSRQESRQKKVC
jgi:hypothetical protein